jgi:hypothetical protein
MPGHRREVRICRVAFAIELHERRLNATYLPEALR